MNAWSRYVRVLDRREPPTALALCRIVLGATVATQFLTAWFSGSARAMWVEGRFGGLRPLDRLGIMTHFGGATPDHVRTLVIVGTVAAACMTVGLFGPLSIAATWLTFRTATGFNDVSGGSGDDLVVNILFVLMFSGAWRTLSLDARLVRIRALAPAWPRYVLVVQLVLMYSTTALQKVSASWLPWGPLDALWYILQEPVWQRTSMLWLAPVYPLTQLATLVTWVFELSAPILLVSMWYRATFERRGRVRAWFNRVDVRPAYLALGIALHVGIWIAMEVGPFLPAILGLYACCVSPHEWRDLAEWPRSARAKRANRSGRTTAPARVTH